MNSVEKIMEWVNSEQSPIRIRSNESFSVPFVSERDHKMYLTLFSYSRSFQFGKTGGDVHVSNVFYINPNDLNDYIEESVGLVEAENADCSLFNNEHNNNTIKSSDVYHELVLLTDKIIREPRRVDDIICRYSELLSQYVSGDLNPYYLQLGNAYFTWLNSVYKKV